MTDGAAPLRRGTRIAIILALSFVGLIAAAAVYLAVWGDRQTEAKEVAQGQSIQAQGETKDLAAEVKQVCDQGGQPAAKLRSAGLCQRSVEIINRPGQTGPAGATGPPGPPPSDQQVARAVTAYCAAKGACAGPRGPQGTPGTPGTPGKAGPAPTPAQVAAAVAAYCNARGECQGPRGETGQKGDTGDKGETGERGPGPTQEQIAAAVTSYCGQDTEPCRGPAGPQGPQGAQGRGVVSMDCVDGDAVDQDGDGTPATSDWLIVYDQPDASGATSQRIDGPCRIETTASPTPLVKLR